MEPLQVSKKRPLATGHQVNYYRVIFTLFAFAFFFSYYYNGGNSTVLREFLFPRSLFALLPVSLIIVTFFIKWTRDNIKDLGSAFFLLCSLYLIGFFAFNGFHTHYEVGIIILVLISNLHLNKILYIVLYNVIVLTALEFVFIAAAPGAEVQPVLFFIFLLLVMLLCIYYQLYRIRYYAREDDINGLITGVISGNPDAWMIFEAPGLVAKDAGSNALKLFSIEGPDALDQISLRTLIAAGTAIESDNIIQNILSGTITGVRTQCRKQTGELFWADIAAFRIAGRQNIIYCRFLDISENKWSQEDANENAIRFRRYLDNISEGLIVCDSEGMIRMVNKMAIIMMEADQIILRTGKNINEFMDSDSETLESILNNKKITDSGLSMKEFQSQSGKLHFSVETVLDIIDNKPEYLIKITYNDQKKSGYELVAPQPEIRLSYVPGNEELFLSTPIPVAVTTIDGKISDVNSFFAQLTGYQQEEHRKLKIENLLHPEDINTLRDLLKNTHAENAAGVILRLITKRGSSVVVNCVCSFLHQSLELKKIIFIFNDITKYKMTETALQQAGSNVTAVIENTDAPIFSIDFNHRITVLNSAFVSETLKRTGQKPIVGDDVRMFFQSDKKADWESIFQKVMKGNKTIKSEIINYQGGGTDYFEISCFPIISNTNLVIGVSALYRKITDQISFEEELTRAKEIAEAATLAKSDFLSTMSHEIRTPLNGVLGMADLLNSTQLNENQKEYVDAIKLSGEALLSVINDVLDYSKIESGKMDLENKPFDVATSVQETFEILRYKAQEKGNRLSFKMDDTVPSRISGDKARLRQILVNLIGNAIKFTEHGTISVEVIPVQIKNQEIEIRFAIKDTGIGMTKEQVGRLFQSFTQADNSTYGKYGGSGLGLTISQRLAGLMNGKIWVESEAGKGSTFYFTITANMLTQNQGVQYSKAQRQKNSAKANRDDNNIAENFPFRILVAEDNEVNQVLAKRLFQKLGYQPVLVNDGKTAVNNFTDNDFDIIFMDVQMPVMNGFEATTAIRNNNDKKQPFIVAMTAHALEGDKEKCLAAGMNDYISKPVNIDTLKNIIIGYGQQQQHINGSTGYKDEELMDQNIVNRLIDMADDDPEFLRKLTELFIKQSDETIDDIIHLASQGDFTTIYQAAHKLKGSSLNLGARMLTEVCKNIEEACNAKDQLKLTESLKDIREVYNATVAIYRKKTAST